MNISTSIVKYKVIALAGLCLTLLQPVYAWSQIAEDWRLPGRYAKVNDSGFIYGATGNGFGRYSLDSGLVMWELQDTPYYSHIDFDALGSAYLAWVTKVGEDQFAEVVIIDKFGTLLGTAHHSIPVGLAPDSLRPPYSSISGFAVDPNGNSILIGNYSKVWDTTENWVQLWRYGSFSMTAAGTGEVTNFQTYWDDSWHSKIGNESGMSVTAGGSGGGLFTYAYWSEYDGSGQLVHPLILKLDAFGNIQYEEELVIEEPYNTKGFFYMVDDQGYGYSLLGMASYGYYESYLHKHAPTGELIWSYTLPDYGYPDMGVDPWGNVLLTTGYSTNASADSLTLTKISPGGNLIWQYNFECPWSTSKSTNIEIDKKGYIYLLGYEQASPYTTKLSKIAPEGTIKWTAPTDRYGYNLQIDDYYNLYVQTNQAFIKYVQGAELEIRDAHNDTIPEVEFELIQIHHDGTNFTEDTLGYFVTDTLGRFEFELLGSDSVIFKEDELDFYPDTLAIGDTIKVSRHVHSEPAVKHTGVLGTMYSVHLDNAKFDSLGVMTFDTLTHGTNEIVMDHAEFRHNLLVSVEWDADRPYLWAHESGWRAMSNYLYDVTDGQARLDTVIIYDGREHWGEADVHVFASNQCWPRANVNGIKATESSGEIIFLPRFWFGSNNFNRDSSYYFHPLDLVGSDDYRTRAHELAHYAFGFWDEYMYWSGDSMKFVADRSLRCGEVANYGLMQYQYSLSDPHASEMSSSHMYLAAACQNTQQWGELGASCWDWFESWGERDFALEEDASDTLFVPIIKPDEEERTLAEGYTYLPGPNDKAYDELHAKDYDVGALIQFPMSIYPPAPTVASAHVRVLPSVVGGVEVTLQKPDLQNGGSINIGQGKTTDLGFLWVLGAELGVDHMTAGSAVVTLTEPLGMTLASASLFEQWLFGSADATAADTIFLTLTPVEGNYPLICQLVLGDGTAAYDLTALNTFLSNPTADLRPSGRSEYSYSFTPAAQGYTASITDSLTSSGSVTINAIDANSTPFFFGTNYVVEFFDDVSIERRVVGPRGNAIVSFADSDTGIHSASVLSSPYPVIRNGLAATAIQAGECQSVSVYPLSGVIHSSMLEINYSEGDLSLGTDQWGDESTLQIYSWNNGSLQWEIMGGVVDTSDNIVSSAIPSSGVYAAFTTQISTDVEDEEHGGLLPYRFELSQNYPNPFNPVTTIEYSLPQRSHVAIVIYNVLGQEVRTLIDREESAGTHTITWDGKSEGGQPVSTGVYLYRYQAGEHVEIRKMLLLK